MKSPLLIISAALLPCFLTQCAKVEPDETPKVENTMVGRISSVSPNNKIILIEKFMPGRLPDDLIYSSISSEGQTASLMPTGERIRNFHAADLIKGTASVGDAVYARRIENTAPSTDLTPDDDTINPTKPIQPVIEAPEAEPIPEPIPAQKIEEAQHANEGKRTLENLARELPQS